MNFLNKSGIFNPMTVNKPIKKRTQHRCLKVIEDEPELQCKTFTYL